MKDYSRVINRKNKKDGTYRDEGKPHPCMLFALTRTEEITLRNLRYPRTLYYAG